MPLFNEWVRPYPKRMSRETRMAYLDHVQNTPDLAAVAAYEWVTLRARDEQVFYSFSEEWDTCLILSGRGWGKTRTAMEWVRHLVHKHHPNPIRIGAVAPIFAHIDKILIAGDSGLMSIVPDWERDDMEYNKTSGTVKWANGSILECYSAEEPDKFRGSQWNYVLLDELAQYKDVESLMMQINFCLRLPPPPIAGQTNKPTTKKLITTTPLPTHYLRELVKESQTNDRLLVIKGSTYDNVANLDDNVKKEIFKYEDTLIGKQEIYGEILGEGDVGILQRKWFKLWPCTEDLPDIKYVIPSIDPAFTEKKENDPSACVVFGVFEDDYGQWCVIILDAWEKWLGYHKLRDEMLNMWGRWYGDEGHACKPTAIVYEKAASGHVISTDMMLTGVNLWPFIPGKGTDKFSKMHSISHLVKDGRVYFPESARDKGLPVSYLRPLMDQLVNFPLVKHDDLCDAFSQGLIVLRDTNILETDRIEEEEYPVYYNSGKNENPYMM